MKLQILKVLTLLLFTNSSFSNSVIKTHFGSFILFNKSTNTVISAPHGSFDINTRTITNDVCIKIEMSCVIATGFTPKGHRININRPSEGARLKPNKELKTSRAIQVYNTFKKFVSYVAQPYLKLYIEIHGARIEGIEIALHNISLQEARLIKNIIEDEWSVQNNSFIPIKVEGIDTIKLRASAVKKFGIVADLQPKFIAFEVSHSLRKKKDTLTNLLQKTIKRIHNVL